MKQTRTLSNEPGAVQPEQLTLPVASVSGANGTFSPNKIRPIHRWYPYLEGYSEEFVVALLDEFAGKAETVHDPFAGTGTTPLVAALQGRSATYCEINPFMRLVIEAKVGGIAEAAPRLPDLEIYLSSVLHSAKTSCLTADEAWAEFSATFGNRPYFEGSRLQEIVALRRAIAATKPDLVVFRKLALVALASIVVDSSELVRAGDLRYRKPDELGKRIESPLEAFGEKTQQIVNDLDGVTSKGTGMAELLSPSALQPPDLAETTDLVITSPPYLNGTNYFRNTKLELWATGFINKEADLSKLRAQAVAAGINNVTAKGRRPRTLPYVESVATELDRVAYDRRIPELVRRYFSDACEWLTHTYTLLRPGGRALIDIGDSRFAGVLVKTDALLSQVANDIGFDLEGRRVLRQRRSKDGSALEQVLLVLRKPYSPSISIGHSKGTIKESAVEFANSLPHRQAPFSARNWGHGWHSLCSYQGKLKPAIAHVLVREFTRPGDVVLDPMSGAGTIPLEASLQGRIAIGNDLQELAYILTYAKVGYGDAAYALQIVDDISAYVNRFYPEQDPAKYADFGLNGRLPEYFHQRTYQEVLAAREYLMGHPVDSWERSIVYASLLHILHGNRPYALSRRSHPVTPFKPTGPFEYKPLAPRLRRKVLSALAQPRPVTARVGKALNVDLFSLEFQGSIDVVITSPPFAGSTRFFVANWMRLWMTGWEPTDFEERAGQFLERRQIEGFSVYRDFFEACHRWLKPGGLLIMHVGRNRKWDMASELLPLADDRFELVHKFDESVVGTEKFGITDQGATRSHQYIFLVAR